MKWSFWSLEMVGIFVVSLHGAIVLCTSQQYIELLKPFRSGDWTVSVINCYRILKLVHRESRAVPFKESISRRVHQSKPYWFVVSNIVAVQGVNNTNMRGITSFNSHHCYQFILRIGMNFVMVKLQSLRTSAILYVPFVSIFFWILNGNYRVDRTRHGI